MKITQLKINGVDEPGRLSDGHTDLFLESGRNGMPPCGRYQ
jgi:hypothetical protein